MTEKEREALQFVLEVIWVNEQMFSDLLNRHGALIGALRKLHPTLVREYEANLDYIRSRTHDQVLARVQRIERVKDSL